MSLESLANELFFEIFDYFYTVELLVAFNGLNERLNSLVKIYFHKHRFDFRRASKKDFEHVCQRQLPFLTNEILSFGLSDDDEIPSQIHLFRSYGIQFNQFIHLRSLTFDHIRRGEIIADILPECSQIIHLNLTSCYFDCSLNEIRRLMDQIWQLPSLIYCYLSFILKFDALIPVPMFISITIEHLTIIGACFYPGHLPDLVQCTPQLRFFAFDYAENSQINHISLQTMIPSIIELNLSYVAVQSNALEDLLSHLPNLRRLKLESYYMEITGYQWENFIRRYLPRLELFQLKMKLPIHGEKRKKDFFKSFQTPFWIDEHRWFVQLHSQFDQTSSMICLYTLPYNFIKLDLNFPMMIQSTDGQERLNYSFDNVLSLIYRSTVDQEMNFQFSNLTHLSVTLPIQQQFLTFVNKLERLNSLEVSKPRTMSDDLAQIQLQSIIDQIPHLYSLKFQSWPIQTHLLSLQSSSIRRYNFRGYEHSFTDEEFIPLCETLIIKMKNRMDVLNLIHSSPNLRSLIVRCDDDNGRGYSPFNDPFIQWFKDNGLSNCSIQRDNRYVQYIRIWIQL